MRSEIAGFYDSSRRGTHAADQLNTGGLSGDDVDIRAHFAVGLRDNGEMATAWLDWTFFLIVLFPVSLNIVAGSVWATWVFSAAMRPALRASTRGTSIALAGICAVSLLSSFVAWWRGFRYADSPSGVPVSLDRVMNAGWVVGLATLGIVIMLAIGCSIRRVFRTEGQSSEMMPT